MNKVILCGRLTRDPEVRYSQNAAEAIAVAKYTLAVDRRQRRDASGANQQTADFIGITAFGKSGEFAEKYFKKGTKVIVTGRIQTGSYTNKDGVKVYTTDVIAEDQEFAESKNNASGVTAPAGSVAPAPAGYMPANTQAYGYQPQMQQPMMQQPVAPGADFMNYPEMAEELPF